MTEVFCSTKIEGTHAWYTCPIQEVDFLKTDHRHLFGVTAYKKVQHDDRDVEFIWLKHEIQDYLRSKYYNKEKRLHVFGAMSCEMLANELINQFDLSRCQVDEDGENGAIVTKD